MRSPGTSRLRRVPRQARSRRRFDAILDTAAQLFADKGFDASSMEAIAAQTHTSIGSVYQFFPDKLAVFEALAMRCLERGRGLVGGLLAGAPAAPSWQELLDGIIDACVALRKGDPGFRALWSNLQLYGVYREADVAIGRELVGLVEHTMAAHAPSLPRAKRTLIATMLVYVVSAMLFLTGHEPERRAAALLAETKIMLRRYLAPYAGRGKRRAGRAKKARDERQQRRG